MHGRLKVKTTAEQQEEKRKKREQKAAAFTAAMKCIFANRGIVQENDKSLKLTEEVLSNNPDVYSLWNIRKEIFQVTSTQTENIDDLLQKELKLLQLCLHVNPKSYGVWNQRRFVMKMMKAPNWKEELQLCNVFLQYDERNFHCWDYRRFVVRESNVCLKEELEFTSKKIQENFSNYSSWHNRSNLLPLVYPDSEQCGKVTESILLKEFELVQNAFFTDPNDQSAWFYQRWLLGRREAQPSLLSVTVLRSPPTLIASFSHPVEKSMLSKECKVAGSQSPLEWECCKQGESQFGLVWKSTLFSLPVDSDAAIEVTLLSNPSVMCLTLAKDEEDRSVCWTTNDISTNAKESLFSDAHTEAKTSVLEGELESCKILLEEEPTNKWVMLTIVYLMRALNVLKYSKETEELLQKLIEADPMRKGYYAELRSKYIIENELQKYSMTKKPLDEVDLSNKGLTKLSYVQYFTTCKSINLSNNELKNTDDFLSMLPCLQQKIL